MFCRSSAVWSIGAQSKVFVNFSGGHDSCHLLPVLSKEKIVAASFTCSSVVNSASLSLLSLVSCFFFSSFLICTLQPLFLSLSHMCAQVKKRAKSHALVHLFFGCHTPGYYAHARSLSLHPSLSHTLPGATQPVYLYTTICQVYIRRMLTYADVCRYYAAGVSVYVPTCQVFSREEATLQVALLVQNHLLTSTKLLAY